MTRPEVRVWLDPSCPWAWQAHVWLRDLRDRGEIDLDHSFFSLEVNAAEAGASFADAAPRYGGALRALALARREAGNRGASELYVALGRRLHEERQPIEPILVLDALEEAGLGHLGGGLVDAGLEEELIREYRSARALDVFGVPTLQIDGGKTMYGPILAVGPTGEDGLALWGEVQGLLRRDVFFELKRWPRDLRPGGAPTGGPP